jgi:hypothetical protein
LYRVALPRAWTPAVAGGDVLTAGDVSGWPRLEIRVEAAPPNVVAVLTGAEAASDLPDYRRIRIEQTPGLPGAVWEFTYLDRAAGTVRASRYAILDYAGRRMFVLDMRTPADEWPTGVIIFDQVVRSFEPVSGG